MNSNNYAQQLVNYRSGLEEISLGNRMPDETPTVDAAGKNFSDYIGQAVAQLDEKVQQMDQDTINVITGGETDLAQVMINMTEAQLSLQTATQVRNKALEAYNDIKNMQF